MLTIDPTLMVFTKFRHIFEMDHRVVNTNSLKKAIFTTGASKRTLSTTVNITTVAQDQYFFGVFLANLYGNQKFIITLTDEHSRVNAASTNNNYTVKTAATAGSNSMLLDRSSGSAVLSADFKQGNQFNVEDSDRLYTINSFTAVTGALVFYPNLDVDIAIDKTLELKAPTLTTICTTPAIDLQSAAGDYLDMSIDVEFEEDI